MQKETDKWDNNHFAYRHTHKISFVNVRWKNTAYPPYVFVGMKTYTLKFIGNNCMLNFSKIGNGKVWLILADFLNKMALLIFPNQIIFSNYEIVT